MTYPVEMTKHRVSCSEPKARRMVRITASGGNVMEGNLMVPKTRAVSEFLNAQHPFLEFETAHGDRIYISKPSIETVQILDYPRPGSTPDAA